MALFNQTSGPKKMQPVLYTTGGVEYAAIITGIDTTGSTIGAVSLAYFTSGSTTLGSAVHVPYDATAVTLATSWRYPEEYF